MKKRNTVKPDCENIIKQLIKQWRKLTKLSGPHDELQTREFRRVSLAIQKFRESYSFEDDTDLLSAYLLYYWIIHYQQGLSVLGELPSTPHRVLDVCSGFSPLSFAALRHGASDVTATDVNRDALNIAAEICGQYGMTLSIREWECLFQKCPVEGPFDLITLSHSLEELFPKDDAQSEKWTDIFLNKLLSMLSPDGHLVIIERSDPDINKRVLKIRNSLVAQGVPVQAPCVWEGKCPALEANNLCYAQREMEKPYLIKEFQRAAKINLSSLKMSYVIFKNPKASWPALPDRKLYRIISPPFEAYHGKTYHLCGVDGKKKLSSHLETHPKSSKAFEYLKRGELIGVKDALEDNRSFEIVEETQVTLEAPLGKPLPYGRDDEWTE